MRLNQKQAPLLSAQRLERLQHEVACFGAQLVRGRFSQHANKRFGAAGSQKHAAAIAQEILAALTDSSTAASFMAASLSATRTLVSNSGYSFDRSAQLREGFALGADGLHQPQRGKNAISGACDIAENNVARLLAAQAVAIGMHAGKYVFVAHCGGFRSSSSPVQRLSARRSCS